MAASKLKKNYYLKGSIEIAKDLIGKKLCTYIDRNFTSGRIVETEAYFGAKDRACHAHLEKRTERTKVMFLSGGISYVYLCYGIHHLFNIVVSAKNDPQAVLISGIEPLDGIEIMLKRRKMAQLKKNLTNGPGNLTTALGIDRSHNGISLQGNKIWLEEDSFLEKEILTSKRINIDYAKEDALLPLRFTLKDNPWIRPISPL